MTVTHATHLDHHPAPGTIRRMADGTRCARAKKRDYPLIGRCDCGAVVFATAGPEPWTADPRVGEICRQALKSAPGTTR